MSNPNDIVFRRATEADRPFMEEMNKLTETFGDPNGELPSDYAETSEHYIGRWTEDQGGILVEEDGDKLGAAWLRNFTAENPGTGYIADDYPEVAIALTPGSTGKGLGGKLMRAVLDLAQVMGHPGISLCVHKDNPRAKHSYEKVGYQDIKMDDSGDYYVMLYKF